MTTEANNDRPTRRLVRTKYEDLLVEIYAGKLLMRPKGKRAGGPAQVEIAWGVLYQRLLVGRGPRL